MSGQGQKARARRAAYYAVLKERFESGGYLSEVEKLHLISHYTMALKDEKETSAFLRKALGDATGRAEDWKRKYYQATDELYNLKNHWLLGWFR